jgi:hypothetical protein
MYRHAVRYTPRAWRLLGAEQSGLGRLRGLGQTLDCSSGFCVDTSDQATTTTLNIPGLNAPTNPTPAGPGVNWGAVFAGDITQGLNIVSKIVAPTTTIQRGPQGQLLIQTPGSSAAGSSLLATGAATGITPNWLLLAGLLVGGVVVVKAVSR